MKQAQETLTKEYTYSLPEDRIAKYPLETREQSRLLVYRNGEINHTVFKKIPDLLPTDGLILYNNTKVIHARLIFHKPTGAKIEIFCLQASSPIGYEQVFATTQSCTWYCMVGNLKKWKNGLLEKNIVINNHSLCLKAKLLPQDGQDAKVSFTWDNPAVCFGDILEAEGNIPIPPYLKRESENTDKERYQTVYAKHKGSVAAPTAGLHFTDEVFENIEKKKIEMAPLTLHVGAGTFQPVKCDVIGLHKMHTEHFSITRKTLIKIQKHQDNIITTGTTTLRTLESLYWLALAIKNKDFSMHVAQWAPYNEQEVISTDEAIGILINYLDEQKADNINASTEIIIVPGYIFKFAKQLITNFHQPSSTLLLLVAAFIGKDWEQVYEYALKNDFRFLSYGDSSLLIPREDIVK